MHAQIISTIRFGKKYSTDLWGHRSSEFLLPLPLIGTENQQEAGIRKKLCSHAAEEIHSRRCWALIRIILLPFQRFWGISWKPGGRTSLSWDGHCCQRRVLMNSWRTWLMWQDFLYWWNFPYSICLNSRLPVVRKRGQRALDHLSLFLSGGWVDFFFFFLMNLHHCTVSRKPLLK